eukprot:scaffold329826_cov51-Prasinocladus_malaysianus.AAC.2
MHGVGIGLRRRKRERSDRGNGKPLTFEGVNDLLRLGRSLAQREGHKGAGRPAEDIWTYIRREAAKSPQLPDELHKAHHLRSRVEMQPQPSQQRIDRVYIYSSPSHRNAS